CVLSGPRLGLQANELRQLHQQKYANGKVVTRYEQLYHGVPVWGEAITRHDQSNSGVSSVANSPAQLTGTLLRQLQQDLPSVAPAYSAAQILQLAKARVRASGATSNEQARLYVRVDDKQVARLVYVASFLMTVPGSQTPSRPFFMIDANTGAILDQAEGLHHLDASGIGGNERTGQYQYGPAGSGAKFGPLVVSNNCTMDSGNVATINMNHTTGVNLPIYQFTCPRNDGIAINGAFSPLNDAHFFGNAIYNMYHDWFGIPPVSKKLLMRVHYGTNYENAFWDGQTMSFGDGASTFYPLVAVDVASHEISHGFTEEHAGFVFGAMPAALNESFSDIAGQAAVWYLYGKGDFTIGSSIFKNNAGPLRYLHNPPLDGHSIAHVKDFSNGIDPHYSSGIFNKAFYALATKPGWSVRKAFELMVDANRLYWTSSSTFNQAACGVERAAVNRGYAVADVSAAFLEVGVIGGCSGLPGSGTWLYRNTASSFSGASGAQALYYFDVPAGVSNLNFTTSGGTGNVDLYLKQGSAPTRTDYLKKSAGKTNAESVEIAVPSAGVYYVLLDAQTAVSNASLLGSYSNSLGNGDRIIGISLAAGASKMYSIAVPAGTTSLQFKLSGGTGNGNLYAKVATPPSTGSFDKKSEAAGNNEVIRFSNPAAGRYYVMVLAKTAVAGATLEVKVQ
ncbi:MAG: M4 family metallopeptidase, partial [Burkholderiales bacterium]|nr:M4 family metallopeptidase [Burkholderiales bacterium]